MPSLDPLPYPVSVLRKLHGLFGGATEPLEKIPLFSVVNIEEKHLSTVGFTLDNGLRLTPAIYLTTSVAPPRGSLEELEQPYSWSILPWGILRSVFLPNTLDILGPELEVFIEDENFVHIDTLPRLINMINEDYFEYWKTAQ